MSYLPLAPRQWEHNRQAAGRQPFTDLVRILMLTIQTPSTPSDAWGSRCIIVNSPQPWVMVCRDRTARPTERVKYLLCCVFSCKGAVQRFSANSG